ncbi:hypothetical protein G6F52_013248 [Rhizopus delemar]|nr:hypothetical protein G6F52_013248 [Rhizopus delemar]
MIGSTLITTHLPQAPVGSSSLQPLSTEDGVVGGRLQQFTDNWIQLFPKNSFLCNAVQHGFKIRFHTSPPLRNVSHLTSTSAAIHGSPSNANDLNKALMDLLQKRAIEPVPVSESYASFVSPLFTVPKKSCGVRPVFNLKALNQYVDCPHFKMETIQDISLMIKPGDHLVAIDLSMPFFTFTFILPV